MFDIVAERSLSRAFRKTELKNCIENCKSCTFSLSDDLLSFMSFLDFDFITKNVVISHNSLRISKDGKCWKLIPTSFDVESLNEVAQSGYSIIVNGINKEIPILESFCLLLSKYFECSVQANAYYTPRNSTGLPIHFDEHDVLVYQLRGCKDWKVWDENVISLDRFESPWSKKDIDQQNCLTIKMQENNWLYIPRGMLHKASSDRVGSLHITFGLFY